MEFIPEGATVNKHRYKEILHCLYNSIHCKGPEFWHRKKWLLLHDDLAHHRFATPSMLTWSRTMQFLFLSLLERKATWVSISVGQGDPHCHKGSRMGPYRKYLSAVFPTAIPMLADLHSGQRRLFWRRMWICVTVCEYLVIRCDKIIVHEIADCSSMWKFIFA
jgi:hypothetical protein